MGHAPGWLCFNLQDPGTPGSVPRGWGSPPASVRLPWSSGQEVGWCVWGTVSRVRGRSVLPEAWAATGPRKGKAVPHPSPCRPRGNKRSPEFIAFPGHACCPPPPRVSMTSCSWPSSLPPLSPAGRPGEVKVYGGAPLTPRAPQLCFSPELEPARGLGLCDPGLMGRSREAGGHSRCPFCSPGSKVAGSRLDGDWACQPGDAPASPAGSRGGWGRILGPPGHCWPFWL